LEDVTVYDIPLETIAFTDSFRKDDFVSADGIMEYVYRDQKRCALQPERQLTCWAAKVKSGIRMFGFGVRSET